MKLSYFDRIVSKEARAQKNFLDVMAVFEKYGYEEFRLCNCGIYYQVIYKYNGKRKTNLECFELRLFYNKRFADYVRSRNYEEVVDWTSFPVEGIWTGFSDVIGNYGIFEIEKGSTDAYEVLEEIYKKDKDGKLSIEREWRS